jgi:hypothetical protein
MKMTKANIPAGTLWLGNPHDDPRPDPIPEVRSSKRTGINETAIRNRERAERDKLEAARADMAAYLAGKQQQPRKAAGQRIRLQGKR